jgi:hypothetical protein
MLDAIENLTDEIIGTCRPSLMGLVGAYNTVVCKTGFDAVGKCLESSPVLHSTH